MRPLVLAFLITMTTSLHPATAQDSAAAPPGDAAFARAAEATARRFEALRDSEPDFRAMFCQPGKPVCLGDWESLRSPLGGWRVIDPASCEVALEACPFGPAAGLDDFGATPLEPPPGAFEGWAPCDVFEGANPSVLMCDDTCGCSILRWHCAGDFTCTSNACSCS